nr:ABC transporter permease subunit [Methylobacterium sp. BTF04]
MAVALLTLPALRIAPNRLVVGTPVYGLEVFGWWVAAILASGALCVGLLVAATTRRRALVALGFLALCAILLALGLGAGAAHRMVGQPPAARASLGAGIWSAAALLSFTMGFAVQASRIAGLGLFVPVLLLAILGTAGHLGAFDSLSLAVEYAARREAVNEAVLQHLGLAGGAVLLGIAGAVLLSLWRRGQGLVAILVGGVQVIPAVALLGALVALVSGLLRLVPSLRDIGLSALGAGPALIGIAAYLLLPLWRGLATALRAPDPASLDAATGLGLTRSQILWRLRLPLGAPILVGALRVAAVQSLGLATLGALIGAGGLGRIVFDGMAQFAPDLILLGAIPIVALSLGAERGLSLAEDAARLRLRA